MGCEDDGGDWGRIVGSGRVGEDWEIHGELSDGCRESLGTRSSFGAHIGIVLEHLHLAMHGYGSLEAIWKESHLRVWTSD